jgi:hypothetical protein
MHGPLCSPSKGVGFHREECLTADHVVSHAQQWMSEQHNVNPKEKPKRVIVLNWMQDLDILLQHFSDFSPVGSEIVFVHRKKQSIPARIGSVRFRQVLCQPFHRVQLHLAAFLVVLWLVL